MKVGDWVRDKHGQIQEITSISLPGRSFPANNLPVITLRQYGYSNEGFTQYPEELEVVDFCDKCGRVIDDA